MPALLSSSSILDVTVECLVSEDHKPVFSVRSQGSSQLAVRPATPPMTFSSNRRTNKNNSINSKQAVNKYKKKLKSQSG